MTENFLHDDEKRASRRVRRQARPDSRDAELARERRGGGERERRRRERQTKDDDDDDDDDFADDAFVSGTYFWSKDALPTMCCRGVLRNAREIRDRTDVLLGRGRGRVNNPSTSFAGCEY